MKVICFGDSNTYGYDPRGYFGGRYDHPWPEIIAKRTGWSVINMGMNGQEIPQISASFPADTDLLIIMLGTNDLLQGASPETVSDKMKHYLLSLDQENILLIAPPPMVFGEWVSCQNLIDNSKSITKLYRNLAQQLGIQFADAGKWDVPIAYDGIHLTEEGHSTFARELIHHMKKGE